jgi:hypothetical protein
MKFEVPLQGRSRLVIQKNDLAMLNIIAANKWKRPIYFTAFYDNLGFGDYLRKDGLTYRLVPVKTERPQDKWIINRYASFLLKDMNTDTAAKNVGQKFTFSSGKGAYFDEENRRHALNIRSAFAETAGNLAGIGKKDEALKILNKCESIIDSKDLPYAMIARGNDHDLQGLLYLEAAYKAGDMALAKKVEQAIKIDLQQQSAYYAYLRDNREDLYTGLVNEAGNNDVLTRILDEIDQTYGPQPQKNVPTVEGKTQQIITNIKDSSKRKKDSSKK